MYQIFFLALLCNTISYGAASSSAAEPPKTAPTELKKTLFMKMAQLLLMVI